MNPETDVEGAERAEPLLPGTIALNPEPDEPKSLSFSLSLSLVLALSPCLSLSLSLSLTLSFSKPGSESIERKTAGGDHREILDRKLRLRSHRRSSFHLTRHSQVFL